MSVAEVGGSATSPSSPSDIVSKHVRAAAARALARNGNDRLWILTQPNKAWGCVLVRLSISYHLLSFPAAIFLGCFMTVSR